jgi:chemotaxis protein histidine kinase CheA
MSTYPKINTKTNKYNLRNNNRKLKKNKPDSSSSESDSATGSEDDSDYETIDDESVKSSSQSSSNHSSKNKKEMDEDNADYDSVELHKYLSKIFPSNYMNEKVKKEKRKSKKALNNKSADSKKRSKHDSSTDSDESEDESIQKIKNRLKMNSSSKYKSKHKGKKHENSDHDTDEESEYDRKTKHKTKSKSKTKVSRKSKSYSSSDEDSDSESSDSDYTENEDEINIVFKLNSNLDNEYYEEFYNENEMKLDNEKEECGSEDEKMFMKEKYEKISESANSNDSTDTSPSSPSKTKSKGKDKKSSKSKHNKSKNTDTESRSNESDEDNVDVTDVEEEYLDLIELKKHLSEKIKNKPHSKLLKNALSKCKDEINKLIKSARFKNTRSYYRLINNDRKNTNEIDYFKKKLSNKEQIHIVNDLKEINKNMYVEKPYRLSILQSSMPPKLKAIALQKLNMLKTMEPGDSEYHKIKNWVDTFMKIPFDVHKNLNISMSDGKEVCSNFIKNAKHILDECVYGLEDAKMQIMQMLGQWIANPASIGSAIAIKGPPGTGKTSLIKDGVSKILGREFAFIALGGAGDSSFLEGHSYTYEGSTWGKIVQILIETKCMNPVIYFDELDKISNSSRGQEIIGVLTHLIDTSQNTQYHDKYFSEVDFDLSKCLFIFSYNDESLVNPILKDRMYCIQTNGYQAKEKIVIARNYLLPKIREQVNFQNDEIIIPDETIHHIITTTGFTNTEDGVRNLKRCLEIIHTKLNLFRLVDLDNNNDLFKHLNLKVTFPFTVTKDNIDIILKSDLNQRQSLFSSMYI